MKKYLFILPFLWFNFAFSQQWTPLNGPVEYRSVYTLFDYNGMLLASAGCGTYASYDNGDSWNQVFDGRIDHPVLLGDEIYCSSKLYNGSSGLYKLDTTGTEWQKELVDSYSFNHLTSDIDSLYKVSSFGLLTSSDGQSFHTHTTGIPQYVGQVPGEPIYYDIWPVKYVSVTDDDIYIITSYDGIYKSSKSNINFVDANANLNYTGINKVEAFGDTVVCVVDDSQIYVSHNGANSWTQTHVMSNVSGGNWIHEISLENDTLFVLSSDAGVLYSLDYGLNWNNLNNGLDDLEVFDLIYSNNEIIIGGMDGVMKNPTNWINSDQGMFCSVMNYLTSTQDGILARGHKNVFYLGDDSTNWVSITSNLDFKSFSNPVLVNNGIFLSVIPEPGFQTDIENYISYDNGLTWNLQSYSNNCGDPNYHSSNDTVIMRSSDCLTLDISHDQGQTWTQFAAQTPSTCSGWGKVVWEDDKMFLSKFCSYKEILLTEDNGASFENREVGLPQEFVGTLYMIDGVLYSLTENGIWHSTNEGLNWYSGGYGIPEFVWNTPEKQRVGLAGSFNGYIFLSTRESVYASNDNGVNWQDIGLGLPNNSGYNGGALELKDSMLYFSSNGQGVFKLDLNATYLGIGNKNGLSDFKIYPSPSEGIVNVEVPNDLDLQKLVVTDINGRLIYQESTNAKQIQLDLSDNTGIFIVELNGTNKSLSKKIVLH